MRAEIDERRPTRDPRSVLGDDALSPQVFLYIMRRLQDPGSAAVLPAGLRLLYEAVQKWSDNQGQTKGGYQQSGAHSMPPSGRSLANVALLGPGPARPPPGRGGAGPPAVPGKGRLTLPRIAVVPRSTCIPFLLIASA